ncbi:guanylate kinase [Mycoplasma feriruminatoris]|uniref:Guanylate kinase n=2 Tax=Mycoplasma feriruminatoris TaxID=1179777 RepID=A0AAQ3DSR6_9MOLU|nr:guanylate kinase [Mycoplasma feriruminatoris]UKS54341.1 guanylate kinase [Mycoplasma feriruminatoris]WFQ90395.1 Guanylate kinase [Mycoplasma feriruminatoris]WFQ91218.1 guanylate kinase [Mycoplasma feriruminatoris]WFQ92038.1 Guanylate kinase [Mycoplasma feriruminatoris]WFQ92883.1 Guanylate kinase [Mycoplasma feriruminatoris]
MKKGKMIIISGPSGVGKGSVNDKLLKNPDLRLRYSVSMTTRKPRNGEVDGVNYFFVSNEEFAKAIVNDELIEYAHFVGNSYGTPRKYVEQELEKGNNVILEIEVDGATQVLNKEANVLSIFLMPPNLTELANRIRGRQTEEEDKIKARLDKALLEIPLKHNYQYVIENDNVANAVAKITDVLHLEGLTDITGPTVYERLEKIVEQIVKEKYMYFVNNWETNVKLLAKNEEEKHKAKNFDAETYLIKLLTKKVYHKVLGHGDFSKLLDKDFVDFKIQKLMFKINFFSVEQKHYNNDEF